MGNPLLGSLFLGNLFPVVPFCSYVLSSGKELLWLAFVGWSDGLLVGCWKIMGKLSKQRQLPELIVHLRLLTETQPFCIQITK